MVSAAFCPFTAFALEQTKVPKPKSSKSSQGWTIKYDTARMSLSCSNSRAFATTSVIGPSVVRLLTGLIIIGFFDIDITGWIFPIIVSIKIRAVFCPVSNMSV